MKKRLLSILLTVCLLMGLLPTAALAAEGDVEYLYCDANGANWQTGTITAREYIVVESGITTWAGGWYVVNSNVDISSRVTVMGNVHLILADGCTLTVNGGIQVTGGKALGGDSLTIYGQENSTGKLIATGTSHSNTGIGGRFDGNNGSGGTITIYGGTVEATGGENAAGIGGGGYNGDGGTVTIHGGKVTATGGYGGAGIGGGYKGDGGTVTINGGTVNATGGSDAMGTGAGIGGGSIGDGGTVTINGGTVTATNATDGEPGIGGGNGGGSGSFRTQEAGEAKGSAMIFAASISDRSDEDNWSGIIFPDWGAIQALPHSGTVYGEQTLPAELLIFGGYTLTIPAGASLTVPGGKTLSIRSDATLTNNGTLYCAGDTVINGTLTNNGTIYVDGNLKGTVSGDGVMYYLLTLTDCKVDAANTAAANTSTVNGKTFGKVGGTIYFAATPSANQLVTDWDVTGTVEQESIDHSSCWISSMPAKPVTVKANFATALTVTQQPQGGTITYGERKILSVAFSKHDSLNGHSQVYQWYLDGRPISGANGSSYTTPADLGAGDHTYTCTITYYVTPRVYTVTSAPATVTVNPLAETAPVISIDYENETLTGFVSGSKYAIDGTAVTTDGGKLSVLDYIGHNISIVTKASDGNHTDSAAQTLNIPPRPAAPSRSVCTINYSNETISFDSYIYEVNTKADFTGTPVVNNGTVTPGTTLYVRKKASGDSFASAATQVNIPARPEKPTVAIDYTAETLSTTTAMEYKVNDGAWMPCTADMAATAFGWDGSAEVTVQFRTKATTFKYASEAQTVTIPAWPETPETGEGYTIDYSDETLTITSGYEVNTAQNFSGDAFSGGSVTPGSVFYIRKAAVAGSSFKSEAQTIQVPNRPDAPDVPTVKSKTYNSVTLEQITDNANGAKAQYSMDGGTTWQDSPEFTGLSASTEYSFVARYGASDNYFASPVSDEQKVTTNAAPSSGGGSSSGGSSSTTTTEKNPDGSTTTTTTNKTTGTVTETTKNTDGSTTTVETKKDGTVTETNKTADGTTGTVVTDKYGDVTEVQSTVSSSAAKEAAKTGEAVTLPVEVPAAASTEDAPAVEVTVPKSAGSVKVEIPVEKVTPGTVAVIVNADGTEEIVSTSVVTENGVALTLDGSATVKIIDNSKDFVDVPETNVFYNEISSLSAREIMIGKTEDTFDLYSSVTLNQIANVAGRITGAVDVKDFNAGIVWGGENGLKTGNVAATRGDVLKALYVAAGSPAVEDTAILARFSDSASIPTDMAAIVAWAAQNGILKGTVDGKADLGVNVTRGQACALAGRAMGVLA